MAAILRRVGLGLFLVLLTLTAILYTRVGAPVRVYAAVPQTLNFQARLLSSSGALVSDGNYSVEFKLYPAASGGVASWTETQPTVQVKAGYLSVYLGSVNTALSALDWSQQYYLTMNVNADGEMNPRLQLTSVPYAFRSNQADKLTNGSGSLVASDLAQLTPATPQVISSALAALRLNQTGTGLLAQFQGDNADVFTLSKTGAITAGTYNTNTFTGTGLTFGGAGAATIQAALNQGLTVLSQGTGDLTLTSGSGTMVLGSNTLKNNSAALTLDVNNAGLSTLNIVNNNGTNLANLDVEGGISAGNGNAFSVNSDGDLTAVFTALNGTSTANGGALVGSTSLVLTSAANFDVGNYVQMNSANCGGAGVNVCYAKVTAKATNTLTITPALTWATGATVNEYHVPELGGINTSEGLASRYGRGYFIAGIATGNGTTYYNENSIETSLASFDLLNTGVTTLNIGGAATALNIGNSSSTISVLGNLQTGATQTITAGGGLTVSSGGAIITGGIDNNSGGITEAGALSGVSTLGLTGAIAGAIATNTINGLIINSGALSGITGITFTSGGLNLASGGLTNGGAFSGLTTLGLSGAITGATTLNTINGLIINAGAVSGATTINASGLVTSGGLTAGTGLIQNTGGITSTGSISLNATAGISTTSIGTGTTTGQITIGGSSAPLVIDSTAFDVSSGGALSGVTTLGLSNAITGATTGNTINGLVINAGSLTAVGSNITGTGALTVSSGASGDLTLDSASNIMQIAASDTTLRRSAAGTYAIDLLNSVGATTLSVNNSDATQVANLTVEGGVSIGVGQTYKVNGTQISSADLSNNINLAKLDGTGPQTFTGNNRFNGTILHQNAANSTTAFQVQNAAGTNAVLNVDTTNGRIGIGTNAPSTALDLNGALTVRGMTAPALSVAGQGRIYFDNVKNKFQSSENGGPFMDLTGFEYLGGTEITAAPINTTGAITVPARDMILIIGRITSMSGGGSIPALRFNGDLGPNYWDRHMKSVSGLAAFTNVQNPSTDQMRVGFDNQTGFRTFMLLIPNRATNSKRAADLSTLATGSAAVVGEITFGGGEWVNTTSQITSVELRAVANNVNMGIESGFGVFGKNFP